MPDRGKAGGDPGHRPGGQGFGEVADGSPEVCRPPADSGRADADALFSLGCRLLEAGEAGEAARQLSPAAKAAPGNRAIRERLAAAYHLTAQYLPALKAYDRLIELDAATAATWCATGNALADLGEYAQAIGAYENSLKQDAAGPEAHHNLARVLYRVGEVERAVHHLEYAAGRCEAIAPWVSLATVIPGSPGADLAENLRGAHRVRGQIGRAGRLREIHFSSRRPAKTPHSRCASAICPPHSTPPTT